MTITIDDLTELRVCAGEVVLLLPSHSLEIHFSDRERTEQSWLRGTPKFTSPEMRDRLEAANSVQPLSSAITYLMREALTCQLTLLTAQGALLDSLATSLVWRYL